MLRLLYSAATASTDGEFANFIVNSRIMVHQLLGDFRDRREGQTTQNWEEEGKNMKSLN